MPKKKKTMKEELEEVINEEEVMGNPNILKYISTGCTLLNLAISDKYNGGFATGTIVNPAGYSHTGKSLLALTALAEAANDPQFDEYELHLQDTENGALFDLVKHFGTKLQNRLIKHNDNSMEAFYARITKMTDEGIPFFYILDSFDGLTCQQDNDRKKEIQKAVESGKDVTMTQYPLKARFTHELSRTIASSIANTGSIIVNISQAKEKMNATMFEDKKVRSGGSALDYYSHLVFWLIKGKTDKQNKGNATYRVGHDVRIDVTKNRITGKSRIITLYVNDSYGIDDITSNINYLESQGVLQKSGRSYIIEEWDFKGVKDTLISFIEDNNKEEELAKMVEKEWLNVEESLTKTRKKRYE